ncbi:carboxy-terminal peptidase [Ectocarpus siliculosus]|uniref:Carboxy-terminal peptidase n=1 Tax=Ectocarpus siliculosus TaxID=2880 RepID=D7FJW2_ECTSI|nr:carboxy-terminal peptidase [Ectocarpus siliculosus]|eukprot:CBJ29210.1 carboxy-terminal peptidase [Ectocarpus siliculosus]
MALPLWQRRPRVQVRPSAVAAVAAVAASRATHPPPSAFRRARPGQAPPILGGGRCGGGNNGLGDGNSRQVHIPLTVLQGWFDGLGAGDSLGDADKGGGGESGGGGKSGGAGGDKAKRKSGGSSSSSSPSSSSRGPGKATPPLQGGPGSSSLFSMLGRLGDGGGTSSGGSGKSTKAESGTTAKGKDGQAEDATGEDGGQQGFGPMQTLAAVGESFSAGAAAFQERFSEISPQNVTLVLGGGKVANVMVPWKGVGIYAGGLLSGLALAVGLLTVPYSDLGSPGLRKSLTLFENVLVDIDQGYVEEVNPERLLETAVGSMLRTLDPYTEYQNNQAAADLKETVSGRYGGVGLVISGGKQRGEQQQTTGEAEPPKGGQTSVGGGVQKDGGGKGRGTIVRGAKREAGKDGITVVSAFEGYAFDAGMRAGDKITAINGKPVEGITVEKARDQLRGEPNSKVSISFLRDTSNGQTEQEITLTRRLVKLRDVKLATLVGDVKNAPVGYMQLSGFSMGAAQELQQAYRYLDSAAEGGLRGVILDMRGNPGGLLEAAVDVSALFVPDGSRIVSIKGRNFQDVTYGSSQGPVRPASTPLVVLTNGGTASAAEIVSGAVQDLDAGVIVGVGNGRTYGKGLVQNVAELPYNNALKYTVAKYYTPSGRCIQSVNYKEGGVAMGEEKQSSGFGFEASEVPELERKEFVTTHGRVVFDGGGVEADVKVKLPKPSALEIALQVQGAYFDFAGQWTKTHTFKGTDVVTDGVLRDFKNFVYKRQKEGTYDLAAIYGPQLESLESILEDSNLGHYEKLVEPLPKKLTQEMLTAFDSRKERIRASLEEAILSRYLPESMVLRKQLDRDPQFQVALELVQDKGMYNRIITPADAKLTEDVLRSFGQALEDSVQRGDLRLDLSSDDGAGITITPTSTAAGARPRAGDGGISTGPNRRSLPQR